MLPELLGDDQGGEVDVVVLDFDVFLHLFLSVPSYDLRRKLCLYLVVVGQSEPLEKFNGLLWEGWEAIVVMKWNFHVAVRLLRSLLDGWFSEEIIYLELPGSQDAGEVAHDDGNVVRSIYFLEYLFQQHLDRLHRILPDPSVNGGDQIEVLLNNHAWLEQTNVLEALSSYLVSYCQVVDYRVVDAFNFSIAQIKTEGYGHWVAQAQVADALAVKDPLSSKEIFFL